MFGFLKKKEVENIPKVVEETPKPAIETPPPPMEFGEKIEAPISHEGLGILEEEPEEIEELKAPSEEELEIPDLEIPGEKPELGESQLGPIFASQKFGFEKEVEPVEAEKELPAIEAELPSPEELGIEGEGIKKETKPKYFEFEKFETGAKLKETTPVTGPIFIELSSFNSVLSSISSAKANLKNSDSRLTTIKEIGDKQDVKLESWRRSMESISAKLIQADEVLFGGLG